MKKALIFLAILVLFPVFGCVTTKDGSPGPFYKSYETATKKEEPEPPGAVEEPAALPAAAENPVNSGPAVHDPVDVAQEDLVQEVLGEQCPDPNAPGKGEKTALSEAVLVQQCLTAQQCLDLALEYCDQAQESWQKGELAEAIDSLDLAYGLILSTDASEAPELIQQKEDLRVVVCRRMLEIYASRYTAATGNHNAIPMVMNPFVEKEIKSFTNGERKFFLAAYQRSGLYRAMMVEKLKEAGLPEELSWLPLIESGYKVRAISSARALGPWQFIASTGYKFGLKRDKYVDQRMDPERSTDAAIAYLKELHTIFGDWATCLAAYNCGEGRVLRTIKSQQVSYLDNFWDLYIKLPRETARYVPRFFATLHIINDPAKYGMVLPDPDPAQVFETVSISRQVHLKQVAEATGSDANTLKALNPELRYAITPPESYNLKVPPKTGPQLLASIDAIPEYSLPTPSYVKHRIRRGETLSTIAKRYRVSTNSIRRANNMGRRSTIIAGRTLKIPTGKSTGGAVASSSKPVPAGQIPAFHQVRSGDSLWSLARRYRTTVASIQKENGLSSDRLRIGQKLKIPGASTRGDNYRKYTVQAGESPYRIAQRHNMSVARFLHINGMTPRSTIYPGQTVMVE